MNTHTRLTLFLVITIPALIITACRAKLVIGPEQTFAVDVPSPASSNARNVTLEIAVPQGGLALAGGADGLIEGGITYNVTEYEPQITNSDSTLVI